MVSTAIVIFYCIRFHLHEILYLLLHDWSLPSSFKVRPVSWTDSPTLSLLLVLRKLGKRWRFAKQISYKRCRKLEITIFILLHPQLKQYLFNILSATEWSKKCCSNWFIEVFTLPPREQISNWNLCTESMSLLLLLLLRINLHASCLWTFSHCDVPTRNIKGEDSSRRIRQSYDGQTSPQ